MRGILTFNPSSDGALAFGRQIFTPPRPIQQMEHQLDLLPLWWAEEGDFVLVHDKDRAERFTADLRHAGIPLPEVTFISWAEPFRKEWAGVAVVPWGWNHTLRRRLLQWGMSPENLPSETELDRLRQLSSRQTAALVMRELTHQHLSDSFLGSDMTFVTDEDEAEKLFESQRPLIFKPPWSSSGKGLIITHSSPTREQRKHILHTIHEKGGILADTYYDKVLDFALEFDTFSGSCRFLAVSVFTTNTQCRYESNLVAPEETLRRIFERHGGDMEEMERLITWYEETFTRLTAPHYRGYMGVDMLLARTPEGIRLHPCVEINMRGNMGILAHSMAKHHRQSLDSMSPFPLTPPEARGFQAMVSDGKLSILSHSLKPVH